MSPRPLQILLILEKGMTTGRVLGRGAVSKDRFVASGWTNLPEGKFRAGRIVAVLYPANGSIQGLRKKQLARLKRMAPHTPLLQYRTARRRSAADTDRTGETDGGAIPVPIPAELILQLVGRERRINDLRQQNQRSITRAKDRESRLDAFAAIVRATGKDLDPHRIMELTMEHVSRILGFNSWLFMMAVPEGSALTVERTSDDRLAAMLGTRLKLGEGIAGRAVQTRQPVLVEDIGVDGATYGCPELPADMTARCVVAVPLMSRGRLIGAVEVVDTVRKRRLTMADARLLALLLEPAAVALDNALLLRKSEELSITDDLTKLYNSRFLNSTLRREVERSKRYRTPVSLIFLDLDGFKDVNDRHGHLFGSRALVEVGRVLKSTVRLIDIVARFGGDEFTVILPQTSPEGARTIAERIRERIGETRFLATYGIDVHITASIGISSFPDHGRTKDDLIARADQAMYVIKGSGKNGVALAEVDSPKPPPVPILR